MLSRRRLLQQSLALTALAPLASFADVCDENRKRRFKIGACDWSIGKRSDVGAFALAKEIGLDGLMVDLGSEQNELHLRQPSVQQAFRKASQETGVKISSLALGVLNDVPYKSDPRTEEWVWDSIDVAKSLNAPVILLAFFNKNDLRNDEAGVKEVIRRLKQVAPKAEKAGVILGIESYLDAAGHLNIMEQVGSKAVKAYMDFRNTADAGYDVFKEVKQLGAQNICELHIKENGVLLGEGSLPWPQIRDLLYEMKYYGDGWMQIEWAMPKEADVVQSYRHNLQFVRTLFNKAV
jgi:sugar phosphate isomerase/epimerase